MKKEGHMRLGLVLVSIVLIFSSVCAADEIKGKAQIVSSKGNSITVSGIVVAAGNARIENEFDQVIDLRFIAIGDYVVIDGAFTGQGQMMAMRIKREYPKQDEIKGKIEAADIAKRELTISGITIKIPKNAWMEGPHNIPISIKQFMPNYYVACKGNWTGPKEFTAIKINLD